MVVVYLIHLPVIEFHLNGNWLSSARKKTVFRVMMVFV